MSTEYTLKALEQQEASAKANAEMGKALESLRTNRHFNKVIVEGYLKDEAIRLVHLKADPSMQTPERQASITKEIDGIGSLIGYFGVIEQRASQAAKALIDIADQREEILTEGI